MSETKFTPGPWTAKQNHWSRWEIHYGAGQLAGVAKPDDPASPPDTYAEAKANAHLMAAAPCLYKAAQFALHNLHRNLHSEGVTGTPFMGDDEHEAIALLTAALAKARGEG